MIPVKILNQVCNQMRDLNGSEYWSSLGAAGVCETVEYFKDYEHLSATSFGNIPHIKCM